MSSERCAHHSTNMPTCHHAKTCSKHAQGSCQSLFKPKATQGFKAKENEGTLKETKFPSQRSQTRSSKASQRNYQTTDTDLQRTTCLRKFRHVTRRQRGKTVAREFLDQVSPSKRKVPVSHEFNGHAGRTGPSARKVEGKPQLQTNSSRSKVLQFA